MASIVDQEENEGQLAQVEAAFEDLQTLHSHRTHSPPLGSSPTVADISRQHSSTVGGSHPSEAHRSRSFEDLPLSVGASTLAKDVATSRQQSPIHAANSASNFVRSSSAMSFFDLQNSSTRDPFQAGAGQVAREAHQPPDFSFSSPQRHNHASVLSDYGQMGDFADESQVPKPLVVPPKSVRRQVSEDRPSSSDSRKITIAEIRAKSGWSTWEPILSPHRQSVFLLDDVLDEIDPHPAVRVPLRGPDSRRAGLISPLPRTSGSAADRERLPGSTPPLTPARHRSNELMIQSTGTEEDPFVPFEYGIQPFAQVLTAFLITFSVWGTILSYGALIGYYQTTLVFSSGINILSLIGSTQVFFVYVLAPALNAALIRGWFQVILSVGSVIFIVSVFCTSLCTQWWEFFLVQGVCSGIGMSMVYSTASDILTSYFAPDGNLGPALAFATSGSPVGGLVFTGIIKATSPSFTFVWTIRTLGFIVFFNLLLAHLIFRPRSSCPRPHHGLHGSLHYIEEHMSREPRRQQGPDIKLGELIVVCLRSLFSMRMVPLWCFGMGVFFACFGMLDPFYNIVANGVLVQNFSYRTSCDLLLGLIGPTLPGMLFPALIVFRKQRHRSTRSQLTSGHSGDSFAPLYNDPQAYGEGLGITLSPFTQPRIGIQEVFSAQSNAKHCLFLIGVLLGCSCIAAVAIFICSNLTSDTALICVGVVYGLSVGPFLGLTPMVIHKLCIDFPPDYVGPLLRSVGSVASRRPYNERKQQLRLVRLKAMLLNFLIAIGFLAGLCVSGQLITSTLTKSSSTPSHPAKRTGSKEGMSESVHYHLGNKTNPYLDHETEGQQQAAAKAFTYSNICTGVSLMLAFVCFIAARVSSTMARFRN